MARHWRGLPANWSADDFRAGVALVVRAVAARAPTPGADEDAHHLRELAQLSRQGACRFYSVTPFAADLGVIRRRAPGVTKKDEGVLRMGITGVEYSRADAGRTKLTRSYGRRDGSHQPVRRRRGRAAPRRTIRAKA